MRVTESSFNFFKILDIFVELIFLIIEEITFMYVWSSFLSMCK